MPPLLPVRVNVTLPAGVEVPVTTVIVAEPEPVRDAGLKLALAPVGKPVALSDTVPANPLSALTLAV
jgi:hypothetical protein